MDRFHILNIVAHVVAGTTALAIGLMMMGKAKGTPAHRRWGAIFCGVFGVVVATAIIGFLFFRTDIGLGSVTALVAYLLLSGRRALVLRGRRPDVFDIALSATALVVGAGLIVVVARGSGVMWKPAVVGPIAGALVFWGAIDMARLVTPSGWSARIWRLEHAVKLMSAVGGLASAGAGTLFPDAKPWSQVGPSIGFSLWIVVYLAVYGRRHLRPRPAP